MDEGLLPVFFCVCEVTPQVVIEFARRSTLLITGEPNGARTHFFGQRCEAGMPEL